MSKQLKITYQDKEYTLEYTRASVRRMEANGFKASEIQDKFVTLVPELFAGAFYANHRWVKRDVIDEIFDHIGSKGELIAKLVEMYNEPLAALVDDPEDSKGNATWTAAW